MKAELTDGSIVSLDDYCQCGCGTVTMRGPCWLRVDGWWKIENRKFLNRLVTDENRIIEEASTCADANRQMQLLSEINLIHGSLPRFAEMEMNRLAEKRRNMERAGIVRLIEEEP